MSVSSPYLAALRKAVEAPSNGFVSIVDDVLALCRQHALQLEWRDNKCRVRSHERDDVIEFSLRKSGFRAMLARIASLCDEQAPGTFEPYGGSGALSSASDSNGMLGVAWMNTPDHQWLVIVPAAATLDRDLAPRIAARAYQLWIKGGCRHGQDQQHWLQAAAELTADLMNSEKSSIDRAESPGTENVESTTTAPSELNAAIMKSK
ncbi:MAG: DUF2934 domain-containing protein [Planctomycetes bacterium]|nr:DUF2934 domain-containing protein [Planctomycetota bacterium]